MAELIAKQFESGVQGYVTGEATVQVHFPIDPRGVAHVNCHQCRFYRINSRRCALNDEVIAFPEKYIGQHCPLRRVDK